MSHAAKVGSTVKLRAKHLRLPNRQKVPIERSRREPPGFFAALCNRIHCKHMSHQVFIRVLAMLEDHCRMEIVISGANSIGGEHLTEIVSPLFVVFREFRPVDMITLSRFLINGEHFGQRWIIRDDRERVVARTGLSRESG